MKIAVIYYGFLRNWHYTNHKRHLIDLYDCDVYINCASVGYDPKYLEWYPTAQQFNVNAKDLSNIFHEKLKGLCIFNYDDKQYIDLIQQNNCNPTNWVGQTSWRIASMLDNMSKSIKLMLSSGTKYDLCIILRGDLLFYGDFKLDIIDFNKINYPVGGGFNDNGDRNFGTACIYGTSLGFNDQIIIGNYENISKLSNLYNSIVSLHHNGAEFNAETLIGKFLINNGINFQPTDMVTYKIDR